MRKKILEFNVLSGGTIRIDYASCEGCATHACVRHCQSSLLKPVLTIIEGVPVLADTSKDTQAGWCTECLSCELMCNLYGNNALHIDLPLKE